jgi:hypothetical protein
MSEQRLREFVVATEQADIEALMSFIHEDCLYITTTGSAPGTEYRGKERIRAIFLEILADDGSGSEVYYGPLYAAGNRGTLEWKVMTPQADGSHRVMRGVDLFEFEGDLIIRKDAFRKVMNP